MRRIRVLLFSLLFISYSYVHQDYSGGTTSSRLDLLHAIVRQGTLSIDAYHENTSDKAFFDGHYYSDKVPGAVLLALPGFVCALVFCHSEHADPISSWRTGGWLTVSWIATASSTGLICALGGVFFFEWISRYVSRFVALVSTIGLFIGSFPFPYATMLLSHAQSVGLFSISLWAVDGRIEGNEIRRGALGGVAAGLGLASELTGGFAFVGIMAFAGLRSRVLQAAFLASATVSLSIIPAYSWLCFGSPLTLGYDYQATFPEMRNGLYGIRWPSFGIGLKLLFSPERGLFFWSPFLVLALIGYSRLFRIHRSLFWLAILVPVFQIVVISGNMWDWRAGWVLGPRYLSPMLPLVALCAALGIQEFPRTGIFLVTISVLMIGCGTIVNATPRYEIANPLWDLHLPGLMACKTTNNIGKALGLPSCWSLVPLMILDAMYVILLFRGILSCEDMGTRCSYKPDEVASATRAARWAWLLTGPSRVKESHREKDL